MTPDVFRNRSAAGRALARLLTHHTDQPEVTVLALPRGGVPVAYEVALALHAPLDLLIVRKLGVPGFEEYAMGALASGGVRVLNDEAVQQLGVSSSDIDRVTQSEHIELERREQLYRGSRPLPALRGRTVIVVDDGLATGATMLAAVKSLRAQEAGRIVVAVPVGAAASCEALRAIADDVVCARTPSPFHAVGQWYEDFSQTGDDEVCDLLERAQHRGRG